MRNVEKLTDIPFLNIHKVVDPDTNTTGYLFAERKGTDSIAFICYDKSSGEFLVNNEFTPPIGEFRLRAFGGSLDKDVTPEQICIEEVKEEAGFTVTPDRVQFVGKVFVSTQMNQHCYLYMVYVNKKDQEDRVPQTAMEADATPTWITADDILELEDWKAITILTKSKLIAI